MIWLIVYLAVCLLIFLFFLISSRAAPAKIQAPEILIVAAHSDDCVIMGAEIAWGIIQGGGKVRIAYMTCSGQDPKSRISQVRSDEARAAWGLLHNENVMFEDAGLPSSAVAGPAAYCEADLARYGTIISNILSEISNGSIILLPASHELHVDHNNARQAAIRALEASDRSDFQVFETTEYNDVLSMRQDPIAVLFRALSELPLFHRVLPRRSISPAFLGGPPGSAYSDTPERLAMKISMLGAFLSQDPALLRSYFSWPSKYRPFWNDAHAPQFKILDRTTDISVLFYIVLLSLAVLFASIVLVDANRMIGLIALIIGFLLFLFAVKKRRLMPGLLGGAIIFGTIVGSSF
jgi:LmbE family N-acetylglucosaminyl deacetylase